MSPPRSCPRGPARSAGVSAAASLMSVLPACIRPWQPHSFLFHDLGTEVAQLRLDDALVGRSHAYQQLLARRAALQVLVRVLVEYLRLRELDGGGDFGGLQQVVDDLHQAVVEVLARVAKILV